MKRINFMLLVIGLGLVASDHAMAQRFTDKKETAFYSDFYVMQVKPMQFEVTYNDAFSERLRIRIIDAEGRVLFVENSLVHKQYRKIFDLSIFNDGRYTFELHDAARQYHQSFSIATMTVRTVTIKGAEDIVVAGFNMKK